MSPLSRIPSLQFSRRDALRGILGAGLAASGAAALPLRAAAPTAKAKSVIQIWMWGGPSHVDTLDPKPAAGYDYCGPFTKPIATRTDGLQLNELLPLMAQQSDKYAVIRSMTHGIFAHETASYAVQTGRKPGDRIVYPCAGAVVSLFKGEATAGSLIPPYIVLTQPQGRLSENGFLGERYRPFATGGDPAQPRFRGRRRGRARRHRPAPARSPRFAPQTQYPLDHAMQDDSLIRSLDQAEHRAYEFILGDAGKVFDLAQEKDDTRDRYGRNTFWPIVSGGAAAGGARRSLRHHQLSGLGYAPPEFPDHAPETAADG